MTGFPGEKGTILEVPRPITTGADNQDILGIAQQQTAGTNHTGTSDAHSTDDEKKAAAARSGAESPTIEAVPPSYDNESGKVKGDADSEDVIIITGQDAAQHLLPLRDDGEPSLTFRGILLATILSAFQAVMYQIYTVSSTLCDKP